jgi:hypothetical protein
MLHKLTSNNRNYAYISQRKLKNFVHLDMAGLVSGDATVSTDVGLLAQPHGDQGLASLASSAPAQICGINEENMLVTHVF